MVTKKETQATELRERMRGGSGSARLTALSAELPDAVRLFSRIVLTPGSSIGEHVHERETELFYFVSGAGVVIDDGAETPVSAGDSMATFDGHRHSVVNTGSEDLVLLAVIVKETR
ncbi:MAG: cupin domain-containing protein [Christensenellaceae bacterium]|nr:cupin domain-containing protein [Christensenellaceae bacterium]MEA5067095.1 cupin domain-containing protein [Eubacteriales bacterium]MEA5068063.1 cupin domain-containing protein [Christensenellaceae bacterium]